MTAEEIKALLDQQVQKLWNENNPRLERLAEYAERCRLRNDQDGERRYMSERADLYDWCLKTSFAIYKPLVNIMALTPPSTIVVEKSQIEALAKPTNT